MRRRLFNTLNKKNTKPETTHSKQALALSLLPSRLAQQQVDWSQPRILTQVARNTGLVVGPLIFTLLKLAVTAGGERAAWRRVDFGRSKRNQKLGLGGFSFQNISGFVQNLLSLVCVCVFFGSVVWRCCSVSFGFGGSTDVCFVGDSVLVTGAATSPAIATTTFC